VPDDVFGVVIASPRQQTLDHLVLGCVELQHGIYVAVAVAQQIFQRLGLGDGAGKSVEQEPGPADVLGKPLRHHRVGDLIRDQRAGIQVVLDLAAQFCLALDVRPEQIAGRNVH
jgi:hypothetical protein